MSPFTVPEGCILVLSDSRRTVYDTLGELSCVPVTDILGIPRLRFAPFEKLTVYS